MGNQTLNSIECLTTERKEGTFSFLCTNTCTSLVLFKADNISFLQDKYL